MNHMRFKEQGLWWPDGIGAGSPASCIRRRERGFSAMIRYFPPKGERRVCVTAGGMNGLWSLEYVKHGFERVITFEPAPHVWHTLKANCAGEPKIEAHNHALGDCAKATGIEIQDIGSSHIDPRSRHSVSMVALDSLNLERCDWLQFDLEGYEFPALMGARETIKRCSPTIQLEMNGSALLHGYDWGDKLTLRLLTELGYREQARIPGSDVIFTRA